VGFSVSIHQNPLTTYSAGGLKVDDEIDAPHLPNRTRLKSFDAQ
jgi:hypothetical protein